MNEPLRPLTLGEILDRTAHLYRSRFLVFAGIGLIPAAALLVMIGSISGVVLLTGITARNGSSPAHVIAAVTAVVAMIVIFVPLILGANALGAAAMNDAAARLFLGTQISIRGAYQTALHAKWRFIRLYVLQGLIILGIPAAVLFVATIGLSAGSVLGGQGQMGPFLGAAIFLLFIALIAAAISLLLRYCLAFPACVIEQTSATSALQRGSRLSRGTRGRILVLCLLGAVLNQVLAMGVMVPALILVAIVAGLSGPAHGQAASAITMVLAYIILFLVQALVKPVYGIALVLFYFDQRIRKEGFDIEWMMQQAGMVSAETGTPIAVQPAVSQTASPITVASPAAIPEQLLPLQETGLINTSQEGKA